MVSVKSSSVVKKSISLKSKEVWVISSNPPVGDTPVKDFPGKFEYDCVILFLPIKGSEIDVRSTNLVGYYFLDFFTYGSFDLGLGDLSLW